MSQPTDLLAQLSPSEFSQWEDITATDVTPGDLQRARDLFERAAYTSVALFALEQVLRETVGDDSAETVQLFAAFRARYAIAEAREV